MICFYLPESLEFVTLQTIIHYLMLEKILWFKINSLRANPGKLKFMVLGNKDERSFNIHINNVKIKSSNEVTLLAIKSYF